MGSKYSHVFEPINIRGVVFKNRLQLAPQSPGLADENGMVTDEFVDFFRPIARGGAAIVTIGNSPVDLSESKDEARHLDLGNDDILVPLSRFADMVTDYGGIASIEINHAGIDAHPEYTNNQVFATSAGYSPAELILGPMMGRKPVRAQAMSFEKVQQTVQKYIDAAARVQQAGFKMVLVHGGHANLIGQFSSPVYNHRTDEYGGSLENRARFAIEILDGIRARCGEGLVIEFRISADEIHPDGMHFEETLQYIDLIKEKIDILHVSAGMHADFQYIPNWMQPYNVSRMLNVHYAEKIKKQYGDYFKVCAVGSIINVANADEIIASGKADFCAMARPYLADPEMPRKYATGHEEDHRPCIRCQFCSDRLMQPAVCSCAVNPQMGRRSFMPTGRIAPALAKKKVAVIGGGVAGITAALTLSERGHDVALYERDSVLGGTLIAATALPVKQDLRDYLQYLRVQAEKSAVNIMLDTEATPETIAEAG
jgi:2,4-dienoyl-CoA reductase-like NADH-dependent reductase (Old Yellow Enzyme family)